MKQNVTATRDIRKGEPLTQVIQREEGYFYFFTANGDAMRAPFARKSLTPEQRNQRAQAEQNRRAAVAARKAQRIARKQQKEAAAARVKESQKKEREARIESKIAALHEKKAQL